MEAHVSIDEIRPLRPGKHPPYGPRARVVAVAQYYPPHVGGLEVVAMRQATSHAAAGRASSVVTCSLDDASRGVRMEGGVTVHRSRAWNYLDRRFGLPFAPIGWGMFRRIGREVRAADVVELHDVLYPASWAGWFWARRYRKELVLIQHVGLVDHSSAAVELMQRLVHATFGRRMFNASARIMAYNPNVASFLRAKGVAEAKIVQLRNGIEVKQFTPVDQVERQRIRAKYGFPEDRPVALFVGRLVPKKGFDVLMQASDPRFDLVFVGSGNPGGEATGPHVRFLGALDRTQVAELYQASDVFVLPTHGELFTLAMQEAMASGLPVITSDDPGYAHYDLDRRLLSLVQPQPAVLRDEILRILGDEALRGEMSSYSRCLAEAWFDWDRNFSTLDTTYQGGPGGRSSRRSEAERTSCGSPWLVGRPEEAGHECQGRAEFRQ
jgi:glycosyltransferase involved in cell wall biosynthesis